MTVGQQMETTKKLNTNCGLISLNWVTWRNVISEIQCSYHGIIWTYPCKQQMNCLHFRNCLVMFKVKDIKKKKFFNSFLPDEYFKGISDKNSNKKDKACLRLKHLQQCCRLVSVQYNPD